MPTINDLHAARWNLVKKGLPFNPDFALCRAFIGDPSMGSPIGPETKLDDGTTAQAYTSGVYVWTGSEVKRA